jgi:hypothetical protein
VAATQQLHVVSIYIQTSTIVLLHYLSSVDAVAAVTAVDSRSSRNKHMHCKHCCHGNCLLILLLLLLLLLVLLAALLATAAACFRAAADTACLTAFTSICSAFRLQLQFSVYRRMSCLSSYAQYAQHCVRIYCYISLMCDRIHTSITALNCSVIGVIVYCESSMSHLCYPRVIAGSQRAHD